MPLGAVSSCDLKVCVCAFVELLCAGLERLQRDVPADEQVAFGKVAGEAKQNSKYEVSNCDEAMSYLLSVICPLGENDDYFPRHHSEEGSGE